MRAFARAQPGFRFQGVLPEDGSKLAVLLDVRRRLRPDAPFILVDHCLDRSAPDFERKLERYAAYAIESGVDGMVVENAKAQMRTNRGLVSSARDEELLDEADFRDRELFYSRSKLNRRGVHRSRGPRGRARKGWPSWARGWAGT